MAINPKCLSVDTDRVFVRMDIETPVNGDIVPILKTASSDFFRKYNTYSTVARLKVAPKLIFREGQPLRFTLWHGRLITKIEAKTKGGWKLAYEDDAVPECLAGH